MTRISIFRPASSTNRELIDTLVGRFQKEFQCQITYDPSIFGQQTPPKKAHALAELLCGDSCDVLWAIRGGEGTADILPYLVEELKNKKIKNKTIIGSSDVTPLLNYAADKFHFEVIHSATFAGLSREMPQTVAALKRYFQEHKCSPINTANLTPMNECSRQEGSIEFNGAVGGNLSLMTIHKGDLWEVDSRDKLVFLEDWQEKTHVIDRGLKYLNRIGLFKEAKALLIGNIYEKLPVSSPDELKRQTEYLTQKVSLLSAGLNIPVFQTSLIGHGAENIPIPMNIQGCIKTGKTPSISFG